MGARGYLANLFTIPPLVFPFQFNPDILQEKKSFGYQQANNFGLWGFDRTQAASGLLTGVIGLYEDFKEWGPLVTATKPMQAQEGKPRTITLELDMDAQNPGPYDSGERDIKTDLDILRSFMYPALELPTGLIDLIKSGCWNRPPEASLSYGGLSLTCVMTDLDIKMTAFSESGDPLRAQVKLSLTEQTHSLSTLSDAVKRTVSVATPFVTTGEAWQEWGDAFVSLYWPFS
jgi:hypothetical protein